MANTQLILFGSVLANATGNQFGASGDSNASAGVFVQITDSEVLGGPSTQSATFERDVSTIGSPNNGHFDGGFSLEFTNRNAAALNGNFALSTYAAGAVVSAVPEPETYAMMLAGLALMSAFGRRRARNPQA